MKLQIDYESIVPDSPDFVPTGPVNEWTQIFTEGATSCPKCGSGNLCNDW